MACKWTCIGTAGQPSQHVQRLVGHQDERVSQPKLPWLITGTTAIITWKGFMKHFQHTTLHVIKISPLGRKIAPWKSQISRGCYVQARQDPGQKPEYCLNCNHRALWRCHHTFIPCSGDCSMGHWTWWALWHFRGHNSVNLKWMLIQFVTMALISPQLHKAKWRTFTWGDGISASLDTSWGVLGGLEGLNRSNSR